MVAFEPPRRLPRVPLTVNGPETARVDVPVVLRTPPFPYTTPERLPSTGALVNLLVPTLKVLESVRSVEDAAVPFVLRVLPSKLRPVPISRVFTAPVPLPFRIPERVVEPVPPMLTASVLEAEKTPVAFVVRTPAPRAEVMVPVLEILKSVDVAEAVEEPIAKSVCAVSPLFD